MNVSVDELKDFFFKAVLHTYAGDAQEKTSALLPGYKVLQFEDGNFQYVDLYSSSLKLDLMVYPRMTWGHTVICYKTKPVWVMFYQGFWFVGIDGVVPTLKAALKQAYQNKKFFGGRGLENFQQGEFKYWNRVRQNDFVLFKGDEGIKDLEAKQDLLRHMYNGFLVQSGDHIEKIYKWYSELMPY